MRIVLLNQFYPPDVAPTGLYLHELGCALVARGHTVTAIASRQPYRGGPELAASDVVDGVTVQRMAGYAFGGGTVSSKLANYAAYCATLAARLAKSLRPDLVVSLTTPPFLGVLGKLIADLKGARHAHWVMDIYPDVAEANGLVDGHALRVLQSLTRFSYAGACAVATLCPAMATRLQRYTCQSAPAAWVPLWAPPRLTPWPDGQLVPLRRERGWRQDQTLLMYSGNLGRGHRFGEFLQAARRLGVDGPRWVFAGAGRQRQLVERFARRHPELPIEVHSYAPEERLREHLCSADVHLISMESAWEGTLFPSKLQASFAVGRPVIFVGQPTLDLARWVMEAEGGWVVREGDITGLLDAVSAAGDPAEAARRGQNARAFAEQRFDRDRNVDALIDSLLPQ